MSITFLAPSRNARWLTGIAAGLVAIIPLAASAHTRERPTPDSIWSAWHVDPVIAIGLLLTTWLYLRGVAGMWRASGDGRVISHSSRWSYVAGVAVLVVALFSPLDALGAALFSAHMVQHLLLFLVAPMLLALGRPLVAMSWALPERARKRVLVAMHRQSMLRGIQAAWSHPVVIWVTFTFALWIWHVPALYDAALRSDLVHALEHMTFLVAAFMFWSWLLAPSAGRESRRGLAVLFIFTSVMQSGVLGALLTFAPEPMYEGHLPFTAAWSLTPIEDQQLAGLLMWIPMGLWLTATTVYVFIAWLRDAERSVRQWEDAEPSSVEGR